MFWLMRASWPIVNRRLYSKAKGTHICETIVRKEKFGFIRTIVIPILFHVLYFNLVLIAINCIPWIHVGYLGPLVYTWWVKYFRSPLLIKLTQFLFKTLLKYSGIYGGDIRNKKYGNLLPLPHFIYETITGKFDLSMLL